MPLMAARGRIPDHFGANGGASVVKFVEMLEAPRRCIRIGLVNNMPDSALKDTESQFFRLLGAAAGDLPVHISLYSLAEIPREEAGRKHIESFYRGIDALRESGADAIIVTGTEPRQSDLRQEPYWKSLAALFDWAETNTSSVILSCLAAHASALHSDGIERHTLAEKRCGVFMQSVVRPHALTDQISGAFGFPHSRWNELREEELSAAGYAVLTKSPEAGADLFVKKKRRSLFVHFQGHPEYGARTLLKEYRRDVARFLRGERERYPSMPKGYFDAESTKLAVGFEARSRGERNPELLSQFPSDELARGLRHHWRPRALQIYGNWLRYVAARETQEPRLAAVAAGSHRSLSH